MSGSGGGSTAQDQSDKKNRFSMEIEDNTVLQEILSELRLIKEHLEMVNGEILR